MTFQTARLARGAHAGPDGGVCAMELVSMLAGAPFGDRPACVCPTLAAFVRGYNDAIDAPRRQDLIRLAPELLGTDAGAKVARERADRCFALAAEARATRLVRLGPPRYPHEDPLHNLELTGRAAARAARRRAGWHERALAFVAALAAPPVGAGRTSASDPSRGRLTRGALRREPAPAPAVA